MKIAIGSDHRGVNYKKAIKEMLESEGVEVEDLGTDSDESVDYPDYATKVAQEVGKGNVDYGVLVCGSGIGVDIVANKVTGARSVNAVNEKMAEMSRRHNNANVISLGADLIDLDTALKNVQKFISTDFEGGRHQRRVDKIHTLTGR
ncbi:MAG: ribose 5-phosphate isomerase B [Ignavibacteriae bacterium]|nr:ribose 5-phosphate isomerase B [Ignavibacteriota bacterium]MCB9242211.1 ribose 5-phosphate isomerase B [Ignavibacteriales bacterium]